MATFLVDTIQSPDRGLDPPMAMYKVDDTNGVDESGSSAYKSIQYAIDDINEAKSSGNVQSR